jgi:hypothetical protein
MSCWTTTLPNSARNKAPVGQASRQPACSQCLHTSLIISQLLWKGRMTVTRPVSGSLIFSIKATCRQVVALKAPVLS